MISAKIIADSISPSDVRLTTLELEYPRFIHSEFMTHRMFSKNASSSRAIPVERVLTQVKNSPAMPIHWGKNQPGMQAREECNEPVALDWDYYNDCGVVGPREEAWEEAAINATNVAHRFAFAGYHKQIVNRLTEPFQHIKVIVTATEWDNFFKLRLHPDAQPEMYELARCMKIAMEDSVPKELVNGQWHLPYISSRESKRLLPQGEKALQIAIKCSVARCARVSYLNHNNSYPDITKDIKLHDDLLSAGHMSPFEHIATPLGKPMENNDWVKGLTHMDRFGNLWSSNFRGWIQYRNMI